LAIRGCGLLAVGTIVLCCWAFVIRFDGRERAAENGSWTSFVQPFPATLAVPPIPAIEPGMETAASPAPLVPPATPSLPPVPLIPPAVPSGAPVAPEHPAHHIANNVAREVVDKALQMREQGDTQGCLTALKEAIELQPGHPKILAELATTYYQIGQEAKSASYWEMVHQMGAERAGTYWDLADMALKGELLEDNAPVNDHLRVSRHFVRSIPGDSDKDQRMVLRIQVEALSKEPIDYRRMYLQVFFYDIVNESRFEQTIADTLPSYISAPYDWKTGKRRSSRWNTTFRSSARSKRPNSAAANILAT